MSDDVLLKDVGLSARVRSALAKGGVHTMRGLLSLSEIDLLRMPNMGKRSVTEVKKLIAESGYKLEYKTIAGEESKMAGERIEYNCTNKELQSAIYAAMGAVRLCYKGTVCNAETEDNRGPYTILMELLEIQAARYGTASIDTSRG